jgi:hypothetical protein
MNPLKSFTISAGVLDVFNLDVTAPDADAALALAQTDWDQSKSANWTPCGPTHTPNFQVEEERAIPPANTKTYIVGYSVTDYFVADIKATSENEALHLAKVLRATHGTYEGRFDVYDSELSEIEVRGVRS